MQINNGFPILAYYDRKDDLEMVYLYYFMKRIVDEDDIRDKLAESFWIEKLKIPEICDSITGVIEYVTEEVSEDCFDKIDCNSPNNSRKLSDSVTVSNPITPSNEYDVPSPNIQSSQSLFSKFISEKSRIGQDSMDFTNDLLVSDSENLDDL